MIERRCVEVRADGDRKLSGVVTRYGTQANMRAFREAIAPGALRFDDVILNLQHDRAKPLARTGAGLTLEDSADQLVMRAEVAPTRIGTDAVEAVNAGLLRGLSVEMVVNRDRWSEHNGKPLRTIQEAELRAIGLVDRPAYPASVLEARAAEVLEARRPRRFYW